MPATTTELRRIFRYEGADIPDPSPNLGVEEVKEILSISYPQFTNATFNGPALEGSCHVYTIKTSVGTNG